MLIDPNIPINTRVRTILLHKGVISLIDGSTIPIHDLSGPNKLETYCQELDPNLDFINVLLTDYVNESENFFKVRSKCLEYNRIHVQPSIEKEQDVRNYWRQLTETESNNQTTSIL
jgi:hypothetical protein